MRWVTRENVKVDRVACPWLIQRSLTRTPNSYSFRMPLTGAMWRTVFDTPGAELGHHGEGVSFDAILDKYSLNDSALRLVAEIVRAADSRPTNPHPAGEGLRWIAHGSSALGLSDHEILEREFIVYDALYAECQRRVSAG